MPNREEIAAKTVATAKVVKAKLAGLHGVFKKLTEEHGEVSALLLRLKKTSDPAVRAALFPTLREALLAHEESEMQAVYSLFKTHPDTALIADHHDGEALKLRAQVERLAAIAYDSPAWEPNLEQLAELVAHHVNEEEDEYFPAGQRAFGDRVDAMLLDYERTKRQVIA